MKNAWGLTGLIGLLAAALSVAAAAIYPWPESVDHAAQVNQKLFSELDVKLVKSISIVSFDNDDRRFESIQLNRVRDSWFIPTANDYPAGNASRIAGIFDAFAESTILEVKSSDASTHGLYGVVDSDTVGDATHQQGIGTKVNLADNNNRPVAQLIIGENVGSNPNQRFVRVAGQPNVYVIELPDLLLSTKLTDWVNHNLLELKLSETTAGTDVAQLQIENYVIEGESLGNGNAKKYNYRAVVNLGNQASPLTLFKPAESGKLGEPITDRKIRQSGLSALASNLGQVPFTAIRKKPVAAATALQAGLSATADLRSLLTFGFRPSLEDPTVLECKNGQLIVTTSDGVDWTLSFGSVASNPDATQTQINYYLLITAAVDQAMFPLPAEPAEQAGDDLKRDYARALKRREDNLAASRERARQYNERNAAWLYLIDEVALHALCPDEMKLVE